MANVAWRTLKAMAGLGFVGSGTFHLAALSGPLTSRLVTPRLPFGAFEAELVIVAVLAASAFFFAAWAVATTSSESEREHRPAARPARLSNGRSPNAGCNRLPRVRLRLSARWRRRYQRDMNTRFDALEQYLGHLTTGP
jgi:hypothetical protein